MKTDAKKKTKPGLWDRFRAAPKIAKVLILAALLGAGVPAVTAIPVADVLATLVASGEPLPEASE